MADALQFNVGADASNFNSAMDGLLGKLAALAGAFLGAQAIIEAFGRAIDLGGRLHDLSTRTGETAGNLAILERAFENTSVGADKVGPAIARMQKGISDAADGTGKAAQAFEDLSLSLTDLQGKTPIEQLQLIGEALARIVDPTERARLAMDIFGRSGAELLPVLVNFSKEVDQAKSQLGSLPEMLTRTAASVDGLGDNLAAMRNKTTELAYGFLSEVVPALEMFTSKLAGVNAASIGAGLAQALVGAFVSPMQAAELLGQSLLLGVKVMGNELVFQVQYWSQLLFNTFSTLGSSVIPMLGNNMRGAFEVAVGAFGTALINVVSGALESLRGIAAPLGFGDELDTAIAKVQEVQTTLNTVMANGAERIADSGVKFDDAFKNAMANSTVVRQDFFGAETAASEIEQSFSVLQQHAKNAMAEFQFDSSEAAAGRTTSQSDTTLLDTIQKIDGLNDATSDLGATATVAGSAIASSVSAINSQLSILAAMNPNQAIGPSASARAADELDKQIEQLKATPGSDPERIKALEQLRDKHRERASGLAPTSEERDAAWDWVMDHMNDPWNKDKSVDELYQEALDNLEDQKRKEKGLPPKEEEDKKKQGEQAKEEEKPKSMQQIVDAMLKLLQKIEPRIPTSNLA